MQGQRKRDRAMEVKHAGSTADRWVLHGTTRSVRRDCTLLVDNNNKRKTKTIQSVFLLFSFPCIYLVHSWYHGRYSYALPRCSQLGCFGRKNTPQTPHLPQNIFFFSTPISLTQNARFAAVARRRQLLHGSGRAAGGLRAARAREELQLQAISSSARFDARAEAARMAALRARTAASFDLWAQPVDLDVQRSLLAWTKRHAGITWAAAVLALRSSVRSRGLVRDHVRFFVLLPCPPQWNLLYVSLPCMIETQKAAAAAVAMRNTLAPSCCRGRVCVSVRLERCKSAHSCAES